MRRILAFLVALLMTGPAFAQTTSAGFTPAGTARSLSVSNVTSNVQLTGTQSTVILWNIGATEAFYKIGSTSNTTATTSDYSIPAGSAMVLNVPQNAYIAAITASSTTTIRITQGIGFPGIAYGPVGSSTVTQNVNLAQVAGATVATGNGTAAGAIRVALPTDGTGVVTVTTPVGITPTDRTITSASGSSETLMSANSSRHSLTVVNTGNANCGVNPTGGSASIGGAGTLTLVPYGSYTPRIPTLSAVTVICTAGQPIYASEN